VLKRYILAAFFILSILQADKLDDKILNLLGQKDYQLHHNLINILFQKRERFFLGDEIRFVPVLKALKKNGLLHLGFDRPKRLTVEFHLYHDPLKSLKVMNDTLKSLGYYYYFTKKSIYDGNGNLTWTITLNTEYAIDPFVLSSELVKQECRILDIEKVSDDKWVYKIDTLNAKVADTILVESNERVILQKPLKPYFIEIKEGRELRIIGRKLNNWFPYIVFYDSHLNVLDVIKKKRIYRGLVTKIPENTKYIKISDLYNLINIKRGLSIIVKS
jgi:hypothetical protein